MRSDSSELLSIYEFVALSEINVNFFLSLAVSVACLYRLLGLQILFEFTKSLDMNKRKKLLVVSRTLDYLRRYYWKNRNLINKDVDQLFVTKFI